MKFAKKADIVIIAVLLAAALLSYVIYDHFAEGKKVKAEIYYYSELVETVDLNMGKDMTFSIPQEPHVIFHLYEDGNIRFEESDCPDKVCINTGKLNKAGQYAACLPNGIVLKIVPAGVYDEDDADIVVGY